MTNIPCKFSQDILLFKLCPHQSYQDKWGGLVKMYSPPQIYYCRIYANFGIKNKLQICYNIVDFVFTLSKISKGPNYRANNLDLPIHIHHVIQGLWMTPTGLWPIYCNITKTHQIQIHFGKWIASCLKKCVNGDCGEILLTQICRSHPHCWKVLIWSRDLYARTLECDMNLILNEWVTNKIVVAVTSFEASHSSSNRQPGNKIFGHCEHWTVKIVFHSSWDMLLFSTTFKWIIKETDIVCKETSYNQY